MKKEEVKCNITIEEGDVIIRTNRGLKLYYPSRILVGALAVALTKTCMQVAQRMLLKEETNELEFTISYQAQ